MVLFYVPISDSANNNVMGLCIPVSANDNDLNAQVYMGPKL